jgi:hypothetical protein
VDDLVTALGSGVDLDDFMKVDSWNAEAAHSLPKDSRPFGPEQNPPTQCLAEDYV